MASRPAADWIPRVRQRKRRASWSRALLLGALAVAGCRGAGRISLDLLPATTTGRVEAAIRVPPKAELHLTVELHPLQEATDRGAAAKPVIEVWAHDDLSPLGHLLARSRLKEGANETSIELGSLARRRVLLEVVPRGVGPTGIRWRKASIEAPESSGNADDWQIRPDRGTPNVIVYVVDTLRADALSVYGATRPTPHFDQLANGGVRFQNAVAAASWTRPGTASILTGLYASSHGAMDRPDRLPEIAFTLAERLRLAGYSTAAVYCNGNIDPEWGFDQGFDFFVRPPVPDRDDEGRPRRNLWAEEAHRVALEQWTQRVRNGGRPVFLYVHTVDPHGPYDPPKWLLKTPRPALGNTNPILDALNQRLRKPTPELVTQLRTLYDGEVAYADQAFGEFVSKLEALDDTIVVFTADHGEAFQEHGFSSHGMSLYEEELHIPLIISAPGRVPRGVVVQEPVSQVDIVPTLLGLTGVRHSKKSLLQGVDLAGFWQGAAGGSLHDRPLMSELDYDGRRWLSLHRGSLKYLLHLNTKEEWVFDLAHDPLQTRNLLSNGGEQLGEGLRADLARLREQAGHQRLEDPEGTVLDPVSADDLENLRALGYVQ